MYDVQSLSVATATLSVNLLKILVTSSYTLCFSVDTHGCSSMSICSILVSTLTQHNTPSTIPGRVAQSVTCLATDACLTADPWVASSIPVRSHTFVEIEHEIISTVILFPSADLFKKGCCQLQAKVCARITG